MRRPGRALVALAAFVALAACTPTLAEREAVMCDDTAADCGNETAPVVLDNTQGI